LDEQVLCSIYRRNLDQVGTKIGSLFMEVGKRGLIPKGGISLVYLNNSGTAPLEHSLTEIRIAVDKSAPSYAGTLGEFTDVKTVPATEVVVATKQTGTGGVESAYESAHWNLNGWMFEDGYLPADRPIEVLMGGAAGRDYAQMRTEIMVSVRKMNASRQGDRAEAIPFLQRLYRQGGPVCRIIREEAGWAWNGRHTYWLLKTKRRFGRHWPISSNSTISRLRRQRTGARPVTGPLSIDSI
jgi:hypothetical protein